VCKRPPSMVHIYSLQAGDRSRQARAYTSTLLPTRANGIRGQPLEPLVRDSLGSSPQGWSAGQGWIRGQDPCWVDHGSLPLLRACCSGCLCLLAGGLAGLRACWLAMLLRHTVVCC